MEAIQRKDMMLSDWIKILAGPMIMGLCFFVGLYVSQKTTDQRLVFIETRQELEIAQLVEIQKSLVDIQLNRTELSSLANRVEKLINIVDKHGERLDNLAVDFAKLGR